MATCQDCIKQRPVPSEDSMSKHGFLHCELKPKYLYQSPCRQACEHWGPQKPAASVPNQANQLF